ISTSEPQSPRWETLRRRKFFCHREPQRKGVTQRNTDTLRFSVAFLLNRITFRGRVRRNQSYILIQLPGT
ncbi:MAG TPA: hypothetical protein PLA68_11545, partial [Panacibacter sp.]|nr:hypothetical protein [Panacibacter sp.]